ncbi:MAG: ABC transporter permease [Gammaproteobacteria bacterium]|nr:MAG: ABC transporter permease [Gammaproteobacteria bacterium]
MGSLQRKLWRELWHIRGQVIAIALVLVGGVGVCIMSLSTYHSLLETRDSYYRENRFSDIFAPLKRAPQSLNHRIAELPGVADSQTRVVAPVTLEVQGFDEPIQGVITSIPDQPENARHAMNSLYLKVGRFPDARRDNEIIISDTFSEEHRLQPGDQITAVINGRRRALAIVGVALSPEYIFQIAPGAMFPDYKRYAVMWMAYTPLAKAYDMDGAFNDLIVQLQPDASEEQTIDLIDHLIKPYGGQGAFGRKDQFSNLFLQEEFKQLQTMAFLFPTLFLGVALFLLNVVITRLISTQREIVAMLKAFGYSNTAIFSHYAGMVLVITALGTAGGAVLGIWLGKGMTAIYVDYYRFPDFTYQLQPGVFMAVSLATLLITLLATARSVIKASSLPPAEAMRPEAPPQFSHSLLHHVGIEKWLSPTSKIIMRQLQRKPGKTLLSIIGLSLACAIMMVGNFQRDAINYMIHVEFKQVQKQDIEVVFNNPMAQRTLNNLKHLPGVWYVEGKRTVPVRLRYGHRTYRTSLQGMPENSQLNAVLDANLQQVAMPYDGILVNQQLAKKLGFKQGDWVTVESLEGHQESFQVQVTQLTKQFMGLGVYCSQATLNKLMREGPAINSALLSIDQKQAQRLYKTLRDMPQVAGITLRQTVIDNSYESLDRVILWFTLINALLGAMIAFGVVYNTIRIALAEQGRELASLRVLGYSHGEVAYILLGELAILTLLSFPLGFWLGNGLCTFMAVNLTSDLYRIPLVLTPYTYAFAALVVILSALVSAALVWRRLHELDLVEVLKTRE